MGLFDLFKKNKPHYDITNIRVQDLDIGFVFDYNLEPWEVKALYEYDWGDNFFSREFKITNGSQTLFLAMEEDDELTLSISEKIKVGNLGANISQLLFNTQEPPNQINYKGVSYSLTKQAPGYFHDISAGDKWEEFNSWEFEDQTGENVLIIEQWGEREFEASVGKYISEFEISNILPSS